MGYTTLRIQLIKSHFVAKGRGDIPHEGLRFDYEGAFRHSRACSCDSKRMYDVSLRFVPEAVTTKASERKCPVV